MELHPVQSTHAKKMSDLPTNIVHPTLTPPKLFHIRFYSFFPFSWNPLTSIELCPSALPEPRTMDPGNVAAVRLLHAANKRAYSTSIPLFARTKSWGQLQILELHERPHVHMSRVYPINGVAELITRSHTDSQSRQSHKSNRIVSILLLVLLFTTTSTGEPILSKAPLRFQ